MGIKLLMAGAAFGLCAITVFFGTRQNAQKRPEARSGQYKLVFIGPGEMDGPIELNVGDMLQVEPFTYPLVADYVSANLKVQLKGARSLELIGQASRSAAVEGRSGRCAFLYAQAPGQTNLQLQLVDSAGKQVEGESLSYVVNVKPRSDRQSSPASEK